MQIKYNVFSSPLAASSSSSDQSFPLSSSLPISSSNSATTKIRNGHERFNAMLELFSVKERKPENLFRGIYASLIIQLRVCWVKNITFTRLSSDLHVQQPHPHPLVSKESTYLTPPRSSLFLTSIPLEKILLLHLSLMVRIHFPLHPHCLLVRRPKMTVNYFKGK